MSDSEDRLGSGEEDHDQQTDQVVGVPLTKESINKSLSRLERIGDGSSHAYVKLDASKNELNCLDILESYPHIRYVYLSSNQLDDLSSLGQMKYLLSLTCDRNNVEKLNIQPMEYLQLLDISYNKINTFDGLQHPRLKTLNLNFNKIQNFESMAMVPFINLEVLELRNNGIESLTGLCALPRLKKLYISQNRISNLAPVSHLKTLETLHIRENEIVNLEGLIELTNLIEINLRQNLIADMKEFDHLVNAKSLLKISTTDNPVNDEEDIRIRLLLKIGSLVRLNKLDVTEEERIEVKELMDSQNEDE